MARIPNENDFVLDIDIEQSNEINNIESRLSVQENINNVSLVPLSLNNPVTGTLEIVKQGSLILLQGNYTNTTSNQRVTTIPMAYRPKYSGQYITDNGSIQITSEGIVQHWGGAGTRTISIMWSDKQ